MFFRKGPSPQQTSLAMVGARPGDRVAFVGPDQPTLAAELALVTGLNGQTLVVGPSGLQPRFEAAATKAGSLLDFSTHPSGPLPLADGAFDICVWAVDLASLPESDRLVRLRELVAALRPGGRIVVIDAAPAPRRFTPSRPSTLSPDAVVALLGQAGALAARSLATAAGFTYYEARTSR